jgi:hypothetical protein
VSSLFKTLLSFISENVVQLCPTFNLTHLDQNIICVNKCCLNQTTGKFKTETSSTRLIIFFRLKCFMSLAGSETVFETL